MNSDITMTLDVGALHHNLLAVRRIASQSRIMAVVKADAYGHGLVYLWPYLARDVDGMAVARVSEAIELRQFGYQGTLLVLGGFDDGEDLQAIDEYQLQTVVHAPHQVALLTKASLKHSVTVWLKIETGMHRLGLVDAEIEDAYQRLKASPQVNHIILMTHFASSEYRNGEVTLKQMENFEQRIATYTEPRSLSNSGGILAWPHAHQHWVRPGLMMYGGSPFSPVENTPLLRPVMRLTAPIKAIHALREGDAVGYNGIFVAQKNMTIAVVGGGYGDGYPRALPNGTPVWLNTKMAKTVGRVSMDSVMIDISDHEHASLGDRAVLWGPELAVETVAEYAKTDPRELLCRMGMHRVQRKIIGDDHGTNN
ncbi:MAG: alanine racemase [Gammaproteobacteria bacterium]|nr:alanine racemase [Gammaproteobacteria bacterium]